MNSIGFTVGGVLSSFGWKDL